MPRLMTYNVRRCLGMDGAVVPERIAEVIGLCEPDIVCLQELDVLRKRTGRIDQAQVIADELSMHLQFHPAINLLEEKYGDAILTTRPARLVKAAALPGLVRRPKLEPRGALWVEIEVDGAPMQLINTHLGLRPSERAAQVEALLGEEWLGHPSCKGTVCLAGDFNTTLRSRIYRRIIRRIRNPLVELPEWPAATFPSLFPFLRIDHVFMSEDLEVIGAETIKTPLARVASDHLPLVVNFQRREHRAW